MSTSSLQQLYRHSLATLTDLYQLTMANGYFRSGQADTRALFNLFFRRTPFQGGYTIACGLQQAVELIEGLRFDQEDLNYLATLTGNDQKPIFQDDFLRYLEALPIDIDLDAIPEGTVVFPHQPLLRLRGPLIACQLLETALLSIINFQTLIATKAARVALAAQGDTILEFGLRRAQGIDGGLSASRAAYVGGAHATSNVLAGKLYGIPVRGTHAHSWVMTFDSELDAFAHYASAMPNNCVFLVDTYDTLQGVQHAIQIGLQLRAQGHTLAGVRLDSGDLAYLSIKSRELLDEAGFKDAAIVASNDLDEHVITSLKQQGAQIAVWGVGTRLSTAYDQPALGGVYKLSAIQRPNGPWIDRIKLSEQAIKVSNPGILQVRRYTNPQDNSFTGDVIYDERLGADGDVIMVDPMDMTRRKRMTRDLPHTDLLQPILRHGTRLPNAPVHDAHQARAHAQAQLQRFHAGIKRLANPHQYPVGLEHALFERKTRMILQARGHAAP